MTTLKSLAESGIACYTFDFYGWTSRSTGPKGTEWFKGTDMRDNDAYVNKVLLQSEDLNAVIEKVKTFDFVDTDNIFCSAAPWAALRSQPAPQRTAKI